MALIYCASHLLLVIICPSCIVWLWMLCTLQSDSACFLFISLSWLCSVLLWERAFCSLSCRLALSCSCLPISLQLIWFYGDREKSLCVFVWLLHLLLNFEEHNKLKCKICQVHCTIFKVVKLLFFSCYTTGGHTLYNISKGRIAESSVWSINYVLQPNTQTQEVMQEITKNQV